MVVCILLTVCMILLSRLMEPLSLLGVQGVTACTVLQKSFSRFWSCIRPLNNPGKSFDCNRSEQARLDLGKRSRKMTFLQPSLCDEPIKNYIVLYFEQQVFIFENIVWEESFTHLVCVEDEQDPLSPRWNKQVQFVKILLSYFKRVVECAKPISREDSLFVANCKSSYQSWKHVYLKFD